MASKGIINRDQHRRELNQKFAARRHALKEELRHSWDDPQKVAELYDQLAKDVGSQEITTKELKTHATEYQAMASKAAATARQVAQAIETQNSDQAENAQKEFDKIVKQEDELVNKINTFCQAP